MKSIIIALRLKPDEYHWLCNLSQREGYTNRSEWLRQQLYHAANKAGLVETSFKKCSTLSDMRTGRPRQPKS